MNDRIKELADQAGVSITAADKKGVFTLLPDKQKKFAELIIRECIEKCREERHIYEKKAEAYDGFVSDMAMGSVRSADNIITTIKEHFGVE